MRCKACDVELTDKEARHKDPYGGYYDLCDECFNAPYEGEEEENEKSDD